MISRLQPVVGGVERSRLRSRDQGRGADGLQRRDGLGDEGGLLLDDGVIDRGAETFVEDFHAEEFGRGRGPVLVGAGDGDVQGQDLVGVPGESWFFQPIFFYTGRPGVLSSLDKGRISRIYIYTHIYEERR